LSFEVLSKQRVIPWKEREKLSKKLLEKQLKQRNMLLEKLSKQQNEQENQ